MRRLQAQIDKWTNLIGSILMGIMMIVLIYNVFARFAGGGISWYMEFTQYLNVWAVLIGGIAVCAYGQHLRISALDEVLKGKALILVKVLAGLATVLFYLGFTYGTFLLATKSKQLISTMAPLKMSYVYWMLPICGLFGAFATALDTCISVQNILKGGVKE